MTEPNSSILMSVPRARFSAGCVTAFFLCLLFSRGELTQGNARVRFQVNHGSASQAQEVGADVRLLELGKPIEREMAGGQSHSYQLTIAAGQYAFVVIEQKRFDVVIKLFAPDGKLITTDTAQARLLLNLKENNYPSYRASLQTIAGVEIFSQTGVKPGRAKTGASFVFTVPAHKLAAGDYVLTLRGNNPDGEVDDLSKSLFRVEKK